MYFTTAGR